MHIYIYIYTVLVKHAKDMHWHEICQKMPKYAYYILLQNMLCQVPHL